MRSFRNSLAGFALLLISALPGEAQTTLSGYAGFSSFAHFVYTPFAVTVAGSFDLYTTNASGDDYNPDPMIWLFAGSSMNGSGMGAALASGDDSATYQSLIAGQYLTAGDYTMAWGLWYATEAEARANYNTDESWQCADSATSVCAYNWHIASQDGTADLATNAVPEPITMTLVGTGLAGIAAARRRRKASARPSPEGARP